MAFTKEGAQKNIENVLMAESVSCRKDAIDCNELFLS